MKIGAGLGAVRSAILAQAAPEQAQADAGQPAPVITISREAAVYAPAVSSLLVELLNKRHHLDPPWIEYDRQLVERVAEDHDLSHQLIEAVQERDRSWIEHFAAGLTGSAPHMQVAMKIAQTIRGLAQVGRAVIVGRGGQVILRDMPGVYHIRLIAPEQWRIEGWAKRSGLPLAEARQWVRTTDSDRVRFVKNHFNCDPADLSLYHLIVNMSQTTVEQAAKTISRLVQ
ncbi:MAG: cytidylate kinase-like family protein [Phycisphaerales bacterium]|nr:cytidylate kinase-like family protein [Phycisphaerales bacterium]